MKTVRQWAEHLPEPIRSQFLENWIAAEWDIDDLEFESIADAIGGKFLCFFDWILSPQGDAYWAKIHSQARLGRFDIPPHIQAATIADDEQAD